MAEIWNAFHFLRPWYLLLLSVPLLFYGQWLRSARNQSSWEKICDPKLLDFLLVKGSSSQRKTLGYLAFSGLIAAIIAAAGPSWVKTEIPSPAPENPTLIVLNLSSEMRQTDLSPSRLERAKYKIRDLLELLPNAQKGLIVYSDEPFMISPLTDDGQLIDTLLPAVDYNIMPVNGDRLDRAIELAAEKFRNAQYQRGEIIIFAPDVGERFDLALEAAKKARAMAYRVNIVATAAAPSEKLQMIAQAGGGRYWNLQTGEAELQKLAAQINEHPERFKQSANWQTVWLDYGYYLLVIPMLCCLYFFRRGILVAVLLLSAQPAEAGFFLNSNQEGLKSFEAAAYEKAGEQFQAPEWKGAAYYRSGDYDKAFREYAKGSGETAMYNQGNALAKGGKIEDAIKKYEEVLQQNPQHEDAKFNLEYLKQQQQQNQQNQAQNQNQDSQKQNEGHQNQPQQSQPQDNGKDDSEAEPEPQDNAQQNQGQPQSEPDNKENQENKEQNEQTSAAEQPQLEDQPQSDRQEDNKTGALNKPEEAPEYDEETQAKAQQYREIPEDPGGLLKALIYKEYRLNRYNQQ